VSEGSLSFSHNLMFLPWDIPALAKIEVTSARPKVNRTWNSTLPAGLASCSAPSSGWHELS